ncbi:MAG: hypothetical protein ACK5LN_13870 [Propioniciclava sp.]
MNDLWPRRSLLTATAGTVAATTLTPLIDDAAAESRHSRRRFTPRSFVDPHAAAAPTASGRQIKTLAVDAAGRVYPGHGDWDRNVGPITLHYLNPRSGTFINTTLTMPTESTEYIRSINGRILVPNADPLTYWEGGQPLALQRHDGTFAMSGWSNTVHAYDVCHLGNYRHAYAVMGSYIDASRGIASHAVYFTFDEGRTFQVVLYPTESLESAWPETCFWVRRSLFVTAKGSLWRWNGHRPQAWSTWHDYFAEVRQNFHLTHRPSVGHSTAANGRIAVMNGRYQGAPGTYAFNGSDLWQVSSCYTPHVAATESGGLIYCLGPQGLLRSYDGRSWWLHGGTTNLSQQFLSLAIDATTVWGGTPDSTIWAFAATEGPWERIGGSRPRRLVG